MRISILLLGVLLLACASTPPIEVLSINITPPGGETVTALTVEIAVQGKGTIQVEWIRSAYGNETIEKTEAIIISEDGNYETTLSAPAGDTLKGRFWLIVYDENKDTALVHSDSVWCGEGDGTLPNADFSVLPDTTYLPSGEVIFQCGHSIPETDTPITWIWNFGDGTIDSLQEIPGYPGYLYNYSQIGDYTVTLTIVSLPGIASVTKENCVHVRQGIPPIADFYAEPTEGTAPLSVTFYNESTEGSTRLVWSYWKIKRGDELVADEFFYNTYPWDYWFVQPGIYTVTLIVSDGAELCDTLIREDYIKVVE